jgi:glycine/D-amino acid oxidase-like deaminating enzyme
MSNAAHLPQSHLPQSHLPQSHLHRATRRIIATTAVATFAAATVVSAAGASTEELSRTATKPRLVTAAGRRPAPVKRRTVTVARKPARPAAVAVLPLIVTPAAFPAPAGRSPSSR